MLAIGSGVVVRKLYAFFAEFWPDAWGWAVLLLLIWVPLGALCGVMVLSHRNDKSDPTVLAAIMTTGLMSLFGLVSTIAQVVHWFDTAYAPLTIGMILLAITAFSLIAISRR